MRSKARSGLLVVLAWTFSSRESRADWTTDPSKHRSGIALGTQQGIGFAQAAGYPDSVASIGNPADRSSSPAMFGGGYTLLMMAAIADFLNFGGWYSAAAFESTRFRSTGQAGGVRVDAFPLYRLVPRLRDLGVYGQFGVGGTSLWDRTRVLPRAYGVRSFVGVGVFYEWRFPSVLGRHLALGPSLEYSATLTEPITRQAVIAGVRLVFYGGP